MTNWDEEDYEEEKHRFLEFTPATRRYIVRALDFGLTRGDPTKRWTRDFCDLPIVLVTSNIYGCVAPVREFLAKGGQLERWTTELAALQRVADFDLQYDEMVEFEAFGFLYERLFGPKVRPWVTSLFCGAATSPKVCWDHGVAALRSLTLNAGPGWNDGRPEPSFLPISEEE